MFSTRLKELRKNANLTQIEFAKLFKVANGTVGNWESGKRQPDHDMLLKIANFFDVPVDYLLGVDSNKTVLNERIKLLLDEKCPDDYTAFAYTLNVPIATVIHWRRGTSMSCYDYIDKIASFFNVSVDYLLGREDNPTQSTDQQLEGIDFALYGEIKDLTEEEKQDILNFVKFTKSQRKE